jgi:hypothetical protein
MAPPGITAFLSGTSVYTKAFWKNYDFHKPPILHPSKEKTTMTLLFDPKTVAMKIEFGQVERKIIVKEHVQRGYEYLLVSSEPVGKVKQKPMYFDNKDNVYTATDKDGYIKVPYKKLNSMGIKGNILSGILAFGGFPGIRLPNGPVAYYNMDLSPEKFPILEWAFRYKTRYFEGNADFTKDTLNCIADLKCTKYTLKSGEGAGSYVLFDSQKRLIEIHTINDGYIIYSYQEVSVKLPEAKDLSSYFN